LYNISGRAREYYETGLKREFGAQRTEMLTWLILFFATAVFQAACEHSSKEIAYPTNI